MRHLTDEAVGRLRDALEHPDFTGTRYRIVGELGRGGMGVVWAATDTELNRTVAIKVLPLHDDSEEGEAGLAREARILAGLEHPGIVPVHDLGRLADGRVYYAMKLVQGERLDRAVEPLSLNERVRLFERICEPVAFANSRGVIHGDLKPSNIMIGPFGEVLVLDWGVARKIAGGPREAAVAGTAGYMAPEQERGEADLDARADVYGLGAILREIGGQEEMPPPLRAVVARATAEAREERYGDAAALAREISRWLDGLPVEAYRESVVERTLRLLRKHRALVALIAAYLVMRAAVAILFHR